MDAKTTTIVAMRITATSTPTPGLDPSPVSPGAVASGDAARACETTIASVVLMGAIGIVSTRIPTPGLDSSCEVGDVSHRAVISGDTARVDETTIAFIVLVGAIGVVGAVAVGIVTVTS